MKNQEIFIYNYLFRNKNKLVRGGQEIYLDYLAKGLRRKKINYKIIEDIPNLFILIKSIFLKKNKKSNIKTIKILNGLNSLYLESILYKDKNTRLVFIQHVNFYDNQEGNIKRLIRWILLKLLLKRVDFIIRVSEKSLPDYFTSTKIKTIYSGVPFPEEGKKAKNLSKKKNINILMVGTICKNKNQELAIKLLTKMENIKLTLVGNYKLQNDIFEKYSEFIKSKKLSIIGEIDNPKNYYMDSDLLLILSKYEGLPLVLLEAMSFGLPVISSRAGGIPEIVKNLQNGILLEKTSIDDLTKNINLLVKEPNLYSKISKNSRKFIKENHTIEIMSSKILDILYSI